MKFRRADMVITPRYRMVFLAALAGLACGLLVSRFEASRLDIEARAYIAAAQDIRAADAFLSEWRKTYFATSLPPAIAGIAASPELSWQTLESRKGLLSAFEKTQPTGDAARTFFSDRSSTLLESGQREP